ncbi:MAG: hypothetical protein CVV49_13360 [Spirochaetae bacterium HGW-Spirochaetae-5]|nr:MAG: hypothetical protein CVV49_13360 [Spirochaetae bacterium HGW-Spirochaetae-5]
MQNIRFFSPPPLAAGRNEYFKLCKSSGAIAKYKYKFLMIAIIIARYWQVFFMRNLQHLRPQISSGAEFFALYFFKLYAVCFTIE